MIETHLLTGVALKKRMETVRVALDKLWKQDNAMCHLCHKSFKLASMAKHLNSESHKKLEACLNEINRQPARAPIQPQRMEFDLDQPPIFDPPMAFDAIQVDRFIPEEPIQFDFPMVFEDARDPPAILQSNPNNSTIDDPESLWNHYFHQGLNIEEEEIMGDKKRAPGGGRKGQTFNNKTAQLLHNFYREHRGKVFSEKIMQEMLNMLISNAIKSEEVPPTMYHLKKAGKIFLPTQVIPFVCLLWFIVI